MDRELIARMVRAFKRRNAKELRRVNDRFVALLMERRDKELVRYAILSYVLSKVASKPRYFRDREKIRELEKRLERLAQEPSEEALAEVERAILELEEKDPRFLFDLFTKARVKLAAVLYAKGMSLGMASRLTGIPKAEILSYAGKTMMFDRLKSEVPVKERVKSLLRYLGGKG